MFSHFKDRQNRQIQILSKQRPLPSILNRPVRFQLLAKDKGRPGSAGWLSINSVLDTKPKDPSAVRAVAPVYDLLALLPAANKRSFVECPRKGYQYKFRRAVASVSNSNRLSVELDNKKSGGPDRPVHTDG